jgi:hypothetical protein
MSEVLVGQGSTVHRMPAPVARSGQRHRRSDEQDLPVSWERRRYRVASRPRFDTGSGGRADRSPKRSRRAVI